MQSEITSALIWQRAEELRCTHTEAVGPSTSGAVRGSPPFIETNFYKDNGIIPGGGITTPTTRGRQPEGHYASSGGGAGYSSTGGLGDMPATALRDCFGHGVEGHGDISYSAIEDNPPNEINVSLGASTREGREPSHRAATRVNTVRVHKDSRPRADNSSRRRNLHQTLATSRRSWQLQNERLRRTTPVSTGNRSFMHSSSSPSRHRVVATSTGSRPINGAKTHGHQEVEGQDVAVEPVAGRRPVSAPAAMAGAQPAGKEWERLTTAPTHAGARSAHQEFHHTAPNTDTTCRESVRSPLHKWNRTMFAAQHFPGGWEARAMMDGGVRTVEERSEEIVHEAARTEATSEAHLMDDVETNRIRTEAASAKRKASKYQTCMLEAQVPSVGLDSAACLLNGTIFLSVRGDQHHRPSLHPHLI